MTCATQEIHFWNPIFQKKKKKKKGGGRNKETSHKALKEKVQGEAYLK
jgi:hypothetical protein